MIKKASRYLFAAVCFTSGLMGNVFAETELNGIRGAQIRCENIVTIWLGRESILDIAKLKEPSNYVIISSDDPDYRKGVNPVDVNCFMRGSGTGGWGNLPKVDHFMHLRVKQSFKTGKTYTIKLAKGLIPEKYPPEIEFSIDKTPNPSFKLNQYGYSNGSGVKLVYLSSFLGDGEPVDLSDYKKFCIKRVSDNKIVFTGDVNFVTESDLQGKDKLYVLDISSFKENGDFYIWVDGLGRSYTFKNGDKVGRDFYKFAIKGLYFQRCGTALEEPYAEKWPRPVAPAHSKVYVTTKNIVQPWFAGHGDIIMDGGNKNSGDWYVPGGPLPWVGGHYDAGDFDQRLTHTGLAEGLMTLYEMMPEKFKDNEISIPEAGNGIPDILDEADWSLRQWVMCQDYAQKVRKIDGGVAPGKEASKHPSHNGMGHKDTLQYFMRQVTPYSSFAGAALFAQASRVFKTWDPNKSDDYLKRAVRAYDYAVKHSDEKWNPLLPWVGEEEAYTDETLNQAWCYAAGQLFSTTGDKKYLDRFVQFSHLITDEDKWDVDPEIFWTMQPWRIVWPVTCTHQNIDPNLRAELKRHLITLADRKLEYIEKQGKAGYKVPSKNSGDWGRPSPMDFRNNGMIVWAYLLTKENKYRDAAALSLDFVLGMNPSEMSWVTCAGSVYPMDPLNYNSLHDDEVEPQPGLLLFGPMESIHWPWLTPLVFHPDVETLGFFRRFQDCYDDVPMSEYVVDRSHLALIMAGAILMEPEK
jgi:endoglucanase